LGSDYTFDAATGSLVITQAYIENLGVNPGDVVILNVTFDVGFAGGLNINIINNDIAAAGSASALANTNIITFTLTSGTFDNDTAIILSNWTLSGIAAGELGDISGILLSADNKTATIIVTGVAYQYSVDYIIEPAQAAFAAGVISTSYVYITVTDPYAVGSAIATTGTNKITYELTTGTFDAAAGIDINNWTLDGTDVGDLGAVLSITLSNSDRTATITVSGTIGANSQVYTIAPSQTLFTNAGYTAPIAASVAIIADTLAVGNASAVANTHVITYVLTTGTFNPATASIPGNWKLGGIAPGELGSVTEVVISADNMTATLTVAGGTSPDGVIQYTLDYTIAPVQAVFDSGFIAPTPATIDVLDPL